MNEYQVFSCHMSVRVNTLITPYWVQIGFLITGLIINNYSLKSRLIFWHYSPRLRRIIVLVYTHSVISTTFPEGNH